MSLKHYLFPQVIHTFTSDFNSEVKLVKFAGRLRLDMGGLTQSGEIIESIWRSAFGHLLPPSFSPKSICILGLGGGSVAKVITKKWPSAEITAVEIDPVVIKIAKQFFQVDKLTKLTIINQDAVQFVKSLTKDKPLYDLILVDCYQGHKIPIQFSDIKFLTKLTAISKMVLLNRLFWDDFKKETLGFLDEIRLFFTLATKRSPSNLVISISRSS